MCHPHQCRKWTDPVTTLSPPEKLVDRMTGACQAVASNACRAFVEHPTTQIHTYTHSVVTETGLRATVSQTDDDDDDAQICRACHK